MNIKKKLLFILGISFLFLCSSIQVVQASVNTEPYLQMQHDWATAMYQYHHVNTYPDLYRPFNSENEAFNAVNKYAYDSEWSIPNNQGFYPVGQSVTLDGDPIETESTVSIGGSETMTNTNLSQTVNLLSSATKYTVSNGTSISTTKGFNLGISSASTFEIPFAKNTTTISFKFNYSHTDTQNNTTTVEYDIPSQSIPVKPGHTVQVENVMTLGKATGSLNINGQMSGTSPYCMVYKNGSYQPIALESLGNLVVGTKMNQFSALSSNTVSYVGGKAQYTANYYSNEQLKVTDITDGTVNFYQIKNSTHH